MKFRTEITPVRWRESIGYDDTILSLGSCFANNIAAKLAERKFRVVASPTGILFNPASIALAIERMAKLKTPCQEELIEVGGRWLSYDFHSDISATTKAEAIATMQKAIEVGNKALTTANYTIITLGTAWVYRLKSSGEVVANCHKQPHQNFSRELLTVADVVEMLERIIKATQSHIIFTVSPVRHIGEGAEDNSLSKSILRVAIAEVCSRYSERTVYFPSYEIMLDDVLLVHISLSLVIDEDHDDVGCLGSLCDGHNSKAVFFSNRPRFTALAETDDDVATRVAEVECVCVTLRAVTNDRNDLIVEFGQVAILFIIHFCHS